MTVDGGQDKRAHVNSVCAEFGDLATPLERDYLFDELLPGEVVLVVLKGDVPLDPNEPDTKRGTGIAVATNLRALFLGYDAAFRRLGMLLPKAGVDTVTFDNDSTSIRISVTSTDGIVYECMNVVPKSAAVRFVYALRSREAALQRNATAKDLSKLRLLLETGSISASEFTQFRAMYEGLPAELAVADFPFGAGDLLLEAQQHLSNEAISQEQFNSLKAAIVEFSGLLAKFATGEIDEAQFDARSAPVLAWFNSYDETLWGPNALPEEQSEVNQSDRGEGPESPRTLSGESDQRGGAPPQVWREDQHSQQHSRKSRWLNAAAAVVSVCALAIVVVLSFVLLNQPSDGSHSSPGGSSAGTVTATKSSRATPQATRMPVSTPTPDNRVFCSDDAYDAGLKELQAFDLSPFSNVRGSQVAAVIRRMAEALDCTDSQYRDRYSQEKQCRSRGLMHGWLAMERIGNQRIRDASGDDARFARFALDTSSEVYANCLIYG